MTTTKPPIFSFWQKDLISRTADIIIVGSGLSGLWLAYHLKMLYPHLRILILEKWPQPNGASIGNAGFACFGSVTELLSDLESMPEEQMLETVAMRYKGISMTREVLGDQMIDYDPCYGYECLNLDSREFAGLGRQVAMLNEKLSPITNTRETFTFCEPRKISDFGFTNFTDMIQNKLEGGLHSGKLVDSLIQKVKEMGVEIQNGMEVTGWYEEKNSLRITTTQGVNFSANKELYICVGGLIGNLTSELPIKPARGQILVTSPIPDLPFRGTFHSDKGFKYFRNIGNMVLIGGARNIDFENETTTSTDTTSKIQNELERWLQEHVLRDRKYIFLDRWSRIMSFNDEKKPTVYSLSPKVKVVHCCNGIGVASIPPFTHKIAKEFAGL